MTELLKSNAPEIKWIINHAATNDFAGSLDRQLLTKGLLTEGQRVAVARIIARNAAAPVGAAVNVGGAGVGAVQGAFATAMGNGLKRPKLRIGDFVLKMAPPTGKNAGAIYVTTADEYLGKIAGGQFHGARGCTDEQRAEVVTLCADPIEAAIAYGRKTGICACCGRELTDPVSISQGIGPICASRWNF
jgi:hypothetical protein